MPRSALPFLILIAVLLASGCQGAGERQAAPRQAAPTPVDALPREAGGRVKYAPAIERFAAADAANPPPQDPTVFIGSSTFTRWTTVPEQVHLPRILNRAFGGSTTGLVLHWSEQAAFRYRPAALVIYGGGNDLAAGISPEEVAANYRELLRRAWEVRPDCQVWILSLKFTPARWHQRELVARTNLLFKAMAAEDPRCHVIDVERRFLGADGTPDRAFFVADCLHLNERGYAILADEMNRAFAR
jgi:lysophospholipase L1-like esterase